MAAALPTPTPEDRFSFGLWTVGWQGVDVFGGPVRPAMDPVYAVERLAALGAAAVELPRRRPGARRQHPRRDPGALPRRAGADRRRRRDGHDQPVQPRGLQGRRLHGQRPDRAPARAGQGARNIDLAAELGAQTYVLWGGREGSESGGSKDVAAALDRYQEALDVLCGYVREQGYDLRFAIEPKPNEPRGDILLPTIGHALAFIDSLEHADLVGLNPEVGHEEMAGMNFGHGIAQALWHGKLFHVDLNGQHGPRFDQDLRFGAGNLRGAFWTVDVLEGHAGAPAYDGYRHFDYKPPRTEDDEGVWLTAAACMRNYLLLRDRVQAFRADPEVHAALEAARVAELRIPTVADGETLATCAPSRTTSTADGLAERGLAFEALDQLAMEHLLGAR